MVARGDDGYLRGVNGRWAAAAAFSLITTTTLTVTLSLLHRLMHCSLRTDVVVQYIHTYIHTYGYQHWIVPAIILQHLERARYAFIRHTGHEKNPAEMTSCTMLRILIYNSVPCTLPSTLFPRRKPHTYMIHHDTGYDKGKTL